MDHYSDIINLPHWQSPKRGHMSMVDRGAQFSPFAALTGYEAVIAESARLTQDSRELTEGAIAALDEILQDLRDRLEEQPWAAYTCFEPDERKKGGSYRKISGRLKQFDCTEKCLILTDGRKIPVESIMAIETEQPERSCPCFEVSTGTDRG